MVNSTLDAVGVLFHSTDTNRYLYLLRNDAKHSQCWGLPGGKVENKESLIDAIIRECTEELGSMPAYNKLAPIELFTSDNSKFHYHTFMCVVDSEFTPVLNDEHIGYAWIDVIHMPKPLHPGLWATFNAKDIYTKLETMSSLHT